MVSDMSRRRFVGAATVLTGAAAATTMGPASLASAASAAPAASTMTGVRTWRGARSANGWQVLKHAGRHAIEGSGQEVALAGGDAAVLLTHVARRFHYEIDQLRAGDVHGHTASRRVAEAYESNYLSGSALAIRPLAYPAGVTGGLYPAELVVIRDILAELDGAVAWGGDFRRPKESHFELAHPPGHPKVRSMARKIAGRADGPGGTGAGAIDAFAPARIAKAKAFALRAP